MTILFWGFALAMLIGGVGFIAIPLKNGKPLLASPGALIAAFVPLTVFGLYALLGSPGAITAESSNEHFANGSSSFADNGQPARTLASVDSMVDGLKAKLEVEPDDAGGWLLLARSYHHLKRHAEALVAYERAQALGKSDVNLEAFLFGPNLSRQTPAPGPVLRGRVALSGAAAAQVTPGDTLFIFAKESRDHRMPVLALRKPVTDLPLDFVLSNNEIMVPGTRLSDYDELIVTAKISRTGNASEDSSGLEAWSDPVSPLAGDRIDLLIGGAGE